MFRLSISSIINAVQSHCQTPEKLRRTMQNRKRGMSTKGMCLRQDNARRTNLTRPPYSSDLAPSDYRLFLQHEETWRVI